MKKSENKNSKVKKFINLTKLKLISKRDHIVKNGLVQKEKYRDTYNGFTTDL